MKNAFEQIYGPPYLARLLFAEVGDTAEEDLFLRVEFDGAIAASGSGVSQSRQHYAVLSASQHSTEMMESFLKNEHRPDTDFQKAAKTALDAWSVGHLIMADDEAEQLPDREAITKHRDEQLATAGIEAAILERGGKSKIRYRTLTDEQIRSSISS
jgi:hypothetical protein